MNIRDKKTGRFVKNRVEKICIVCGISFSVPPCRQDKAKYCSHKCQGIAFRKRIKHLCLQCKTIYELLPCADKSGGYSCKFCSQKCYHAYQKKHATYSRGLLADLYEWKKWAMKVLERDDFTCQLCGKRGGKLQAHHLYMVSEYPDIALEDDNGITTCVPCHKKIHKQFGTAGRKQGELREGRLLMQWLNPEPSRVESRKVQRLLEERTRSLITSFERPVVLSQN